ncbi:antifreeze protein [Mycena alexandri]|uniref:Antifreeze protein n=1 Tax=Mycena alexandri TaxID=1745969 RepID=A0AAD6WW86_9AGAR|nr:antifreeze protein [Mycena alexandri]
MIISSLSNICLLAALSTSAAALGPAPVNLRTAACENYVILAKSGVSVVPPCVITGPVGVSPIAATGLTGFSLTLDPSGQFSTSAQVTGHIFAASYRAPIPAQLSLAVADMGTAFTDATGRANPDFTNLASGAICGLILAPGLYKWTTGVSIGCDITFSGSSTDTWILQVAGTLSIAAGEEMLLAGGALASNIFWVVTGAVLVGAGAHTEGVILGKTSCTYLTGATAEGCLLCQTSVALQKATIHN